MRVDLDVRIIPAHAGGTTGGRSPRPRSWDHPRSRGGHDEAGEIDAIGGGSSPLTRGALRAAHRIHHSRRIIPAHAGGTSCPPRCPAWAGDHPRSRGGHGVFHSVLPGGCGSSPLTRGAHEYLTDTERSRRIIPAHAGGTPPRASSPAWPPDHPRSRGGHREAGWRIYRKGGSSPLTRGARLGGVEDGLVARIIPAHAGGTKLATAYYELIADHPRSRGGHPRLPHRPACLAGSSPLTRGGTA